MYLKNLKLATIRNLQPVHCDFSSQFNWIFGKNGSGKTSLLEAIYLLSTGRSFRTRFASEFIQENELSGVVSGIILADEESSLMRLGVERHRKEGLRLHRNEQSCQSLSDWVKLFPLQIINVDSYLLLNGPPMRRRQFIDWPMFHVEPSYFSCLKRYRRVLKQRNAILKGRKYQTSKDITVWDNELHEVGTAITLQRKKFLEEFYPLFLSLLKEFFSESMSSLSLDEVKLDFFPGWDEGRDEKESLISALTRTLERDMALGYTTKGPHRADFSFYFKKELEPHKSSEENYKSYTPDLVQTKLSRGQLKLFISALYLARSRFVSDAIGKPPVSLVDDLCSELDSDATIKLLRGLFEQKAQIFITSIEKEGVLEQLNFLQKDYRMFHVEHGMINLVEENGDV